MPAEIVLPITEPETEWIAGRAVQKVSPSRDHSRVQTLLAVAVVAWAEGRGEAGTEWRFRIEPPGEARRPLVPDLAFVTYELLSGYTREELQAPPFAPSVAFEVLSPDDRPSMVSAKIEAYLTGGTSLVVVLDPALRAVSLHETGAAVVTLHGRDTLVHPAALPGFRLELEPFFAKALDLHV